MRITLDEWLELERQATQAKQALERLHNEVSRTLLKHEREGHTDESQLLLKLHDRVHDAQQDLAANLYWVQSEWTGGDSCDPKNYTLREPNWVTISHSFPREQVEKYRDAKGEIHLPSRCDDLLPREISEIIVIGPLEVEVLLRCLATF